MACRLVVSVAICPQGAPDPSPSPICTPNRCLSIPRTMLSPALRTMYGLLCPPPLLTPSTALLVWPLPCRHALAPLLPHPPSQGARSGSEQRASCLTLQGPWQDLLTSLALVHASLPARPFRFPAAIWREWWSMPATTPASSRSAQQGGVHCKGATQAGPGAGQMR